MTNEADRSPEAPPFWSELKLPSLLYTEGVQKLHAAIESEWDPLLRSACQTAAGRALWKHVTNDMLAELLAGETQLTRFYQKIQKDCFNQAREVSGVILAVRTLWFDSKLEAAVSLLNNQEVLQVVLLGAGMDTRAYRLNCLSNSHVFEVDFPQVLQMKASLLQEATVPRVEQQVMEMKAKMLSRVEADIRGHDWLEKLKTSGFVPEKNTVWILEGILYYLSSCDAIHVLKTIAAYSTLTKTVVLADFMNKPSTMLSNSTFQFYCDWPDELLPSLGFSDVKLSQIGDPDAQFGLLNDPLNMFNKLRTIPRSVDVDPENGTPCCRLYLVQATGSPSRTS
ncbi:putative S-adenosyl-L-methionine-dependent methyltransferase [Bienertia sinuspersici]